MKYALLALIFLLPLELVRRAVSPDDGGAIGPGETRGALRNGKYDLAAILTLVIFSAAVLACIATVILIEGAHFIDDAFITYRYSFNLIHGHGLAWNPGEPPLEGFTNILLVVLVAPFLALGADPLTTTRILSFLGLGVISILLYRLGSRHLRLTPMVAAILAAAYPLVGLSVENALSGLETVLFTTVLFAAFYKSVRFIDSRRKSDLAICGGLCFVGFLFRPEAVFLMMAIPVTLLILWRSESKAFLNSMALFSLTFGAPLVVFLLWKYWYFGTIIPNPALVKIPGSGIVRELGLASITTYLSIEWKLLVGLLLALMFPVNHRGAVARLIAGVLIAIFVAFYLRVDTLMDIQSRFLYPLTPILYFLALPAFGGLLAWIFAWRGPLLTRTAVAVVVSFVALWWMPEGPKGYVNLARSDPDNGSIEGMLERIAQQLQKFGGIEKITIASQDAGLIPYFTHVRHLDTAGLNDRYIARERDVRKLSNYIFDQHPELIIFRSRKDGTLLTYAHGPLGDQTKWSTNPGWDDYDYVGTVDQPDVHSLHFFVRRDSAVATSLGAYVKTNVAGRVEAHAPVALGSR